MCAPHPPLPLLCFLCLCPPHTHVVSLKHPPTPPSSFHPSLFLCSHCDLELHAARRRTKWLASLLFCVLSLLWVWWWKPTRRTTTNDQTKPENKQTKKHWLASNLQLLNLRPDPYSYIVQAHCRMRIYKRGDKLQFFQRAERADWNSAGVIHLWFSVSRGFPPRFP